MPPKPQGKPGDKKPGGAQQFVDDDYSDLATLPPINNFVFATVPAFKYKKNLQNVYQQLLKYYSFQPEDPMSQKIKVIQREDIINFAKLKQYITEEESLDLQGKLSQEKVTEVFAKASNDLLMSFEVAARRLKKDQPQIDHQDVETTLWLKDFPQTIQEFKAFYQFQTHHQHIHSVFVLEELFLSESEDEEILKFSSSDPTMDRYYQEQERKRIEEKKKVEYLADERIQAFQTVLEVGKIFAQGPPDSDFRLCTVNKIRFQGPDSSTLLHDSTANADLNQSREISPEAEQQYQEFAQKFKEEVDSCARDLQEYRLIKKKFKNEIKTKPLMPYPEEILKKIREEEERQKEIQRKLDEEKKAKEALLQQQQQQQQTAGKKGAPPAKTQQPPANQNNVSRENLNSQGGNRTEMHSRLDEMASKYKAMPKSRDDEEKEWHFHQFEKVMAELNPDYGSVGNILAAMVYQISTQKTKSEDNKQGDQTESERNFILKTEEQENDVNDYFEDIFNKLSIEHNIVETSFRHQFQEQPANRQITASPYQSLFNENDRVSKLAQTYTFLSGEPITMNENKTLQKSQLPGINNRLGMPQQPTIQQPQRESDLSAILSFSNMPASQTRRTLLLHQCQEMFKQKNVHPEREFFFLDRNFVEKYDATTLRQVLSNAMRYTPEFVYHYEQKEDALLLGIYYKNPPGRLLRRQWTAPIKVFPDYQIWRNFVKHEANQAIDYSQLYDIDGSKIGIIRTNSKYCFPCDNSILRIDKLLIGSRRLGSSLVIKDNLVFGIKESNDKVKAKLGMFEDEVLNREAWAQSDRRCTFWLEFENGTKLLVEMADKQIPHLEEIPLHEPLPQNLEEETKIMSGTNSVMQHGGDVEDRSASVQIESVAAGQAKPGISKNDSVKSIKQVPGGKESTMKQNPPPAVAKGAPTQQSTLQKSDSAKSIGSEGSQPAGPSAQELAIMQKRRDEEQRLMSAASKNQFFQDRYDPTSGAKLTFTFQQGLIVMIMPNGDVSQQVIENIQEKKKYGGTLHQDSLPAYLHEKSRLITRGGQVIRYFLDGNMQIFYPDGTVTTTDKRKGVWFTVNSQGVKRVRKLQDNLVYDEPKRLKITEKQDPETSAHVQVREDGVLIIRYIDDSRLVMMPDGTQILTKKNTDSGSGTITVITKEGFAPVRLIYDPVKARAKTVIGLGGADSMMGVENIMERTNNGKVTEVILPDKTVVQSYQERQELEGFNNFTTNMVHLIRRDDFSIIKVRQDGEMVLISSNQRAFLNSIGKQKTFGVNDYDHYFELFGVPNERRSGVYTVNLDQGRLMTQDEEGNVFIVYANGDSVEKLSVSFNLDQMVEGIEQKEPDSPKIQDGEFIEEECKFLPPPKTIAHPRLFLIKNDIGYEFSNSEQLEYLFRCTNKDSTLIRSKKPIRIDNEDAVSHLFMRKTQEFDPNQAIDVPKIPQTVELVNQTVSIPKEPIKEEYQWRNIVEYKRIENPKQVNEFNESLKRYQNMRKRQQDERERLKVVEIKTEEHREHECKIWLRIAKEKGIDISSVIGEEYKPLKDIVNEEKKQKFLDDLDNFNSDDETADNPQAY